jgi:hypothetical protein
MEILLATLATVGEEIPKKENNVPYVYTHSVKDTSAPVTTDPLNPNDLFPAHD